MRGQDSLRGGGSLRGAGRSHCSASRLGRLIQPVPWGVPQPLIAVRHAGSKVRAWLELATRAQLRVACAAHRDPCFRPSGRPLPISRNPTLRTMAHTPVGWAAPARPCAGEGLAKGVALSDPAGSGGSSAGRPPQPRWRALRAAAGAAGVDPPVRPRCELAMIAVAIPRYEASVIDSGRGASWAPTWCRRMEDLQRLCGADRFCLRAANRLRQRRG